MEKLQQIKNQLIDDIIQKSMINEFSFLKEVNTKQTEVFYPNTNYNTFSDIKIERKIVNLEMFKICSQMNINQLRQMTLTYKGYDFEKSIINAISNEAIIGLNNKIFSMIYDNANRNYEKTLSLNIFEKLKFKFLKYINEKFSTKFSLVKYIKIKDEAEQLFNNINRFANTNNLSSERFIICSAYIGAILQSHKSFIGKLSNELPIGGSQYILGKLNNFIVIIDPYLKFKDTAIYIYDNFSPFMTLPLNNKNLGFFINKEDSYFNVIEDMVYQKYELGMMIKLEDLNEDMKNKCFKLNFKIKK